MGLDEGEYFVDQPTDNGECKQSEGGDKENRALNATERMRAGIHHAENHGEQNPADEIVEHRRGHHHGAHLSSNEIEIHQDLGDHGKRGYRKRGSYKQGEDQPAGTRFGAQESWERARRSEAQSERNDYPEEADQQGALALAKNAA